MAKSNGVQLNKRTAKQAAIVMGLAVVGVGLARRWANSSAPGSQIARTALGGG